MRNLILLLLSATLLTSCMTAKKAEDRAYRFFRENPAKAARLCADQFPVKDSVGQAVIVTPANNKDYTGKIDSLQREAEDLRGKLLEDSIKTANGAQLTPQEIANYKTRITSLEKKIIDLKRDYKPCEPEIREKPVYRENTAKVAALTAERDEARNDLKNTAENLKKSQAKANMYFWLLVGAGVAIGIGVILIIRK